jgi:hypothetical protein
MKKTICFSLLAFLFLGGCSKSEDLAVNSNENQLKSASVNNTVPMFTSELYNIPLVCDGIEIDRLQGRLDVFCRMHYENGIIVWMIHNFSGSLTDSKGEVFDVNGVRKIDSVQKSYTFHSNIKGNLGSHYILYGTSVTTSPNTLIIEKASCPQSAD